MAEVNPKKTKRSMTDEMNDVCERAKKEFKFLKDEIKRLKRENKTLVESKSKLFEEFHEETRMLDRAMKENIELKKHFEEDADLALRRCVRLLPPEAIVEIVKDEMKTLSETN
jgi:hypothetical protein